MRITSGGRTQRFSGRGTRRVAAKTKRDPVAAMIRTFGEAHAAAAAEILRGSPEAAQWTEWGIRELLGWRGVLADRKSTRLNSSHITISYAVFCLKKKNKKQEEKSDQQQT